MHFSSLFLTLLISSAVALPLARTEKEKKAGEGAASHNTAGEGTSKAPPPTNGETNCPLASGKRSISGEGSCTRRKRDANGAIPNRPEEFAVTPNMKKTTRAVLQEEEQSFAVEERGVDDVQMITVEASV